MVRELFIALKSLDAGAASKTYSLDRNSSQEFGELGSRELDAIVFVRQAFVGQYVLHIQKGYRIAVKEGFPKNN